MIYLSYKYPNQPWVEFDRTRDKNWAEVQFLRMKFEFPGAEYKKETESAKAKSVQR